MLQRSVQWASDDFSKLEILGPDKNMFGILAAQRNGARAFVIHRNGAVYTIMQDSRANSLTITAADGTTAASMAPLAADRLELKVEAGVCPLLVLSTVLAVLILV